MHLRRTSTFAVAALVSAGQAGAAGLDRSGQSVAAIFAEDGETTAAAGLVFPDITGEDLAGGGSYRNVGDTYSLVSLSHTNRLSEDLSYAVIVDQPYGADVSYDADPTATALGGTGVDLNSGAVTFVARYRIGDRISVFGGIGVERIGAEVSLNGTAYRAAIGDPSALSGVARGLSATAGTTISPTTLAAGLAGTTNALDPVFAAVGGGSTAAGRTAVASQVSALQDAFSPSGGYRFRMDESTAATYLVGAAYEIPAIALRIAGTYRFETEHGADTTEQFGPNAAPDGTVDFVSPQSFNLEMQTGIAPGTLLTASWRWTEFSAVDLVPDQLGSDLVNLEDANRYSVGIGRQFTEGFAASAAVIWEPKGEDDLLSPLGPTDGLLGLSFGARFVDGPLTVTGGVNYSAVGDARPEVGGTPVAQFSGNSAVGVGLQATYSF